MTENYEGKLELATMISALRGELEAAQSDGRGHALQFKIDGIEIEAAVQVQRAREGHGGVKFWVVEAGAGLSQTDSSTQRIKLTVHPAMDTVIADSGRPT